MAENPYAPPQSRVADASPSAELDGDFLPEGQRLPAGRGWGWIADAWAFTGVQRGTFIVMWIVAAVLWVGLSIIPLVGTLIGLFSFVIAAGVALGCDALRRGEPLEVGHLFAGFRAPQMGRLVAIGAIFLGAFVVFGIIVGIALVALSLAAPGGGPEAFAQFGVWAIVLVLLMLAVSVPMSMAIWFAPQLVVLHDFTIGAALRSSFNACLKNMLPFLVFGLAGFGLMLLTPLTLFLGWFLLGPLFMVTSYVAYRDIYFAR